MLNDFFIFVAPFIVIIAAIAASFWVAKSDESIIDKNSR